MSTLKTSSDFSMSIYHLSPILKDPSVIIKYRTKNYQCKFVRQIENIRPFICLSKLPNNNSQGNRKKFKKKQ